MSLPELIEIKDRQSPPPPGRGRLLFHQLLERGNIIVISEQIDPNSREGINLVKERIRQRKQDRLLIDPPLPSTIPEDL